jgi:heme/copper-type cytochrome/quinol oxidase subunit 2
MTSNTLRQSRDFGNIITDTFTYVRDHFKTLGKGLLLFSLPVILLSGILLGSGFGSSLAIDAADPASAGPEDIRQLAGIGFKFLAGILLLMVTFIVIIVIVFKHMQLIDSGYEDDEIEMNDLLGDFARNFFGLTGLIIVIAVATTIGFIFLIIPGLYVSVKLSLAPAIFIVEQESFFDALSKSWRVTEDNWWFTFGVSIVMSIIVNIVSNVAIVPFYFIMIIFSISSGNTGTEMFTTLFSVFYGLTMIIVGLLYCFPIISQGYVYFTLNERQSGDSLMSRIETIGD